MHSLSRPIVARQPNDKGKCREFQRLQITQLSQFGRCRRTHQLLYAPYTAASEHQTVEAAFLFDTNVIVLTLFPGIQEHIVTEVLKMEGLKAVVMKTFGTGNAPQREWFVRAVREATQRGLVIINITQCPSGSVDMKRYENGRQLLEAGVTSGYDSTIEAAVTKLMFLLGHGLTPDEVRRLMNQSLAGEITLESDRPLQQESFT